MTGTHFKRRLVPCCILFIALGLHVASLCVLVRYYSSAFVFEFGEGFATLYWGGSENFRNSCVYNAGEWPIGPDTHFAGDYLADGQRWEVYGPGTELSQGWLSERIQSRGAARALGYTLPQVRHNDKAASMIVPLGSVAFIVEAGVLLLVVKSWFNSPESPLAAPPRPLLGLAALFRHGSLPDR